MKFKLQTETGNILCAFLCNSILEYSLYFRFIGGQSWEADIHVWFYGLTSLRREAQQVCLIFHTTAATRRSERKQLEWERDNNIIKHNDNIYSFHESSYVARNSVSILFFHCSTAIEWWLLYTLSQNSF